MRHRRFLPPALLLAVLSGALAGCSDEKDKNSATAPLQPPAPAADTTKPGADKPAEPKPVPDQPPLKN